VEITIIKIIIVRKMSSESHKIPPKIQ
jgi:hypothetical protein